MKRSATFQVAANVSGTTLRIRFVGDVAAARVAACVAQVEALLAEMRPGFSLLTDLSGLTSMETACAPFLGRMMDVCREKGVSKIVRVIPDPAKDIGFNILSHFHHQQGVQIATCETYAEAEKALES